MGSIYLFSGPCGCGKTTLAHAFARRLAAERGLNNVYLIHGDAFHAGIVAGGGTDVLSWPDILQFNWDCMLSVAAMALKRGLDVVMDYVVEDELPLVQHLAAAHGAALYYVVLTASEEAIIHRITRRGDTALIDRALFLKKKLDSLPENRAHLLDNTDQSADQTAAELQIESFRCERLPSSS